MPTGWVPRWKKKRQPQLRIDSETLEYEYPFVVWQYPKRQQLTVPVASRAACGKDRYGEISTPRLNVTRRTARADTTET